MILSEICPCVLFKFELIELFKYHYDIYHASSPGVKMEVYFAWRSCFFLFMNFCMQKNE